jgi:hypothetical protein
LYASYNTDGAFIGFIFTTFAEISLGDDARVLSQQTQRRVVFMRSSQHTRFACEAAEAVLLPTMRAVEWQPIRIINTGVHEVNTHDIVRSGAFDAIICDLMRVFESMASDEPMQNQTLNIICVDNEDDEPTRQEDASMRASALLMHIAQTPDDLRRQISLTPDGFVPSLGTTGGAVLFTHSPRKFSIMLYDDGDERKQELADLGCAQPLPGLCEVCAKPTRGRRHCAACKHGYYCSRECQAADWARHKLTPAHVSGRQAAAPLIKA